jgi:hypothetical protein
VTGQLSLIAVAAILGTLIDPTSASAQPPASALPVPRLNTVMPNGGRLGSTLEVTFTGQDVEEPQALLFSHPGIRAEPIIPPAPPADPKKPAAKPAPRPPVTKFKVTISPGATLGIHDVRLVNKWGVSNPRAFVVGDLAEVQEKEPNDDVPQAQRVELNSTVTGVIGAPTDVDYFVFRGTPGQRVLVSCLASSIDSRLFPALQLFDSAGRQLAMNRHYSDRDALLDYTLPAAGDYYVRLTQLGHIEGSPEHFYRLTLSTAPWIDAIVPPMVEPGKTTPLVIYGRNLPGGQLDPPATVGGSVLEKLPVMITPPSDPEGQQRLTYTGHIPPPMAALDGFEFRLRNAAGVSNPFLLGYAHAPMVLANETSGTAAKAQEITAPCEIAGRIGKRNARDWYVFKAKKNDVYNIDVVSERLGATTDMYLVLRNAKTKQIIAEVDDNPDVLTPVRFYNRTDDPPTYRFTAPEDGSYQLMVSSRTAAVQAGPRCFYRVRITPDRPDFRLIVQPADEGRPDGCCLRQGGHEEYVVLVARQDGWTGPVTLVAEGLPAGVSCPPQTVGPNLRQAALVLSASPNAPSWTGEIRVKGTAVINGQTVVREARPATITWPVQPQQGIPAISRLDRNLVLAVRDKAPFDIALSAAKTTVLQDSKIKATLKLTRHWPDFKGQVQATPHDPAAYSPANLLFNNNQAVTIPAGKDTATAEIAVPANVVPGTYNLVLVCTASVPFNKDASAKQKPETASVLPSSPLTLTVLPKQVATLSVNNANPTLKAGAQAELIVKVARQFDFTGEFKVQLVAPPGVQGVSAQPVVIPAGKDEAKLVLQAAANAAPGNRANLPIQAVALIQPNVPLTHEVKINVNITK